MISTHNSSCRYCGEEPFIGDGHTGVASKGLMKVSFLCKSCAQEYFQFLAVKMPNFGSETLTEEQAAELAKHDTATVFSETDAHMKKWLAERGNE